MCLQGLGSPRKLLAVIIPPAVVASISTTSGSSASTWAYSPVPFDDPAVTAGTSAPGQSSSTSYFPAQISRTTSGSSTNAQAYSPVPFNDPAVAAGTSAPGQSFSTSYFPVQTSSTSSSLFSAQLPSSGSTARATHPFPSTSYQFTDPFM